MIKSFQSIQIGFLFSAVTACLHPVHFKVTIDQMLITEEQFPGPLEFQKSPTPLQFQLITLCWGKGGWDVPEYAGCVRSCFEFTAQSLSRPPPWYNLKPQLRWHLFHARPQQLRTSSLNKSQANSKHTQRGWNESWKK